jgi:predicted AAA+ superfamily ATPase
VTRWDYYYFRTKNGAEIDLILEGSFGVLPIEIKVGQKTTLRDLTFLQRFITKENLPFGVVVNNSQEVRMLSEKIIQIPAGCL